MKPLVTIITPMYNCEKFLDEFIDTLVKQTYKNIQFIAVDDGSTDRTYEILESKRKLIDENVSEFLIVRKANGGQPSAINAGLKHAKGKYLTWPDSDDLMHPDYIEEKVKAIEVQDVDLLLSQVETVDTSNPDRKFEPTWTKEYTNEQLLEMMVNDNGFRYEPGGFFVKRETFQQYYPDMHIYDGCTIYAGPQIQMTMGFLIKGRIGYLHKILFTYRLHSSNHHNRKYSAKGLVKQQTEISKLYEAVLTHFRDDIGAEKCDLYIKSVKTRIETRLLRSLFEMNARRSFNYCYKTASYHHTFKEFAKLILINTVCRFKGKAD